MNSTKNRSSIAENNIKVFCRFRPLDYSEERTRSKFIVNSPADNNGNCILFGGKLYLFDKVFNPDATQEEVYNETTKSIVTDVLAGYNGTIFAYGQTSSGKTHTMEGVIGDKLEQGIIPRIGSDIFNHVYKMEETMEFHIEVSHFEIYMNRIRDLLDVSRVNLGVHEDKNGVPFVRGITERFVSSPEEIYETIQEGRSNRQIAITSMNEHSSRSHSVFMISIKAENRKKQKKQSSKLYLVDLAGFEKVSKTGAEGTVLDEAKNINKSLSALRNVISALTDTHKSHIPYRDSVLTRILQESLGGNAKTTIIVCCSPAKSNESETKSTLQFGNRVKTIKNLATVNEELTVEESNCRYKREKGKVARLKSIIERLQSELSRWRLGEHIAPEEQVCLDKDFDVTTPITTELEKDNVSMLSIPDNEFVIRLLSNGDRKRLKEERERFHQELNEKNNKINHQLTNLARLENQIKRQEKIIGSVYQDCEQLQQEMSIINLRAEKAKNRTLTILQKLGCPVTKLILNEDKKSYDVGIEREKKETIPEIAGKFATALNESSYITDVDPDLETFTESAHSVGSCNRDSNRMVSEYRNELSECRIIISQHDGAHEPAFRLTTNNVETYQYKMSPVEVIYHTTPLQKPDFVGAGGMVNEIAELKEIMLEMHVASKKQMDQVHNSLQQIAALEIEVTKKQDIINELKDENRKIVSIYQQTKTDYEELKQLEGEKSARLQELMIQNQKHEETSRDIRELDERVNRELHKLHTLRECLNEHLQITVGEPSLDDSVIAMSDDGGVQLQKQKVLFLENNLEQLTKIHIQLLEDNVHLRYELSKLEMKLRESDERVEALERALRDSKKSAMWERKRYQFIVYNIEKKFKNKSSAVEKPNDQISVSSVKRYDSIRSADKSNNISHSLDSTHDARKASDETKFYGSIIH